MVERSRHGRQGWQERQEQKQATAVDEAEARGAKEARQRPGQDLHSRKRARRSWLSLGRGCLRLNTSSCWRRATASNASLWRGRKNARMYTIIGRIKPIAPII